MPARYSVVQYVPDPLAGERINIGVLVYGGGVFHSRFLENWDRVECFATGEDISFLREFAGRIQDVDPEQLSFLQADGMENVTAESIASFAGGWINSIQITEPRGSVRTPTDLLPEIASRFLRIRQPGLEAPRLVMPRTRNTAVRIVVAGMEAAVRQPQVDARLMKQAKLTGAVESHRFDAIAESWDNAGPVAIAHGLSFELSNPDDVSRNVDALGLAVRDIRDAKIDVPIGILALRRIKEESGPFLRALHIFNAYGARVLGEDEMTEWATAAVASRLAPNVHQ